LKHSLWTITFSIHTVAAGAARVAATAAAAFLDHAACAATATGDQQP
jgi:hypothetical protein